MAGINLYEAGNRLAESARMTEERLATVLNRMRGPIPESPSNGVAGTNVQGVFVSLERTAGSIQRTMAMLDELNVLVGEDQAAEKHAYANKLGAPLR